MRKPEFPDQLLRKILNQDGIRRDSVITGDSAAVLRWHENVSNRKIFAHILVRLLLQIPLERLGLAGERRTVMSGAKKLREEGRIGTAHLSVDQLIVAMYGLLQSCVGGRKAKQGFDEGKAVTPSKFEEFGFANDTVCCFNGTVDHKVRQRSTLKIRSALAYCLGFRAHSGFESVNLLGCGC